MKETLDQESLLFSYGTLQYEAVQIETFGRKLEGHRDFLLGYKLNYVEILDQKFIELSGESVHKILDYTGNSDDMVEGMVFKLNKAELHQADLYEVDSYKRVLGKLKSGISTWVYAKA